MLAHDLSAFHAMGIPIINRGTNFRVLVRPPLGRAVFISNPTTPRNLTLLSRTYKISRAILVANFNKSMIKSYRYEVVSRRGVETHKFDRISEEDFYPKLEAIISNKKNAFKINVSVGYEAIDTVSKEKRYFHPNPYNTSIFELPVTINKPSDVQVVMQAIKEKEKHDISHLLPNSRTKLSKLTGFWVQMYHLNYLMGDSDALIPEVIKKNRHVINFPKTENKCLFFCIAYHLSSPKKDPRYVSASVKKIFRQYCEYKGIAYSLKLYREFQPIDLLEVEDLEDCFKLNINVFSMNVDTCEVSRDRRSSKSYESTMNILQHNKHAMYITLIDNFLGKHQCPKCNTMFGTHEKLRDYKKNQCEEKYMKHFVKKSTFYQPNENVLKRTLTNNSIYTVDDHYLDHFLVYGFESILKPTPDDPSKKTTYDNVHIPVSVSVCDSLTRKAHCFINDSPRQLLEDMLDHIEEKARIIRRYNNNKFEPLLRSLLISVAKIRKLEEDSIISEIDRKVESKEFNSFSHCFEELDEFFGTKEDKGRCVIMRIKRVLDQVPVVGFNSGRYDINIIKNDLFAVLGPEKITNVIRNPAYMCISTDKLKMLDISNYFPAGTSYDKYLTTYLGGCQCDDKIRCLCGLGKGIFPYEYITDFSVLNESELPPKGAFFSKLRDKHITDDEYARVQFIWKHYDMKTLRDLLVWYNYLDVKPFVEAIKKQRMFFRRYGLDMFVDGLSLLGLSEKIMYQIAFKDIKPPVKVHVEAFDFPASRFRGYRAQDNNANREFDLSMEKVNSLMRAQSFHCGLCYRPLTEETVSVDRINNKKGHLDDNVFITCKDCNIARKDMSIKAFRRQKLLEYNCHKVVYSIDEEHKEIYEKMKAYISGGPSIIFNRFAKRNETLIRGGKVVKKIVGYDANALYLWALGNEIPCGRLTTIEPYEAMMDEIKSGELFGFLECDIETPDHLKGHFEEMTPIFKNVEIEPSREIIGDHMFEFNRNRPNPSKRARKLIGSYFGEKILIYTARSKYTHTPWNFSFSTISQLLLRITRRHLDML